MAVQEPDHSSQGARIVGALLKVWPVKEAPLPVQIAFYEQLQRAVEPYGNGKGQEVSWFRKLDHDLRYSLGILRPLAAQQVHEAQQAKRRLDVMVNRVPADLRGVLREARP